MLKQILNNKFENYDFLKHTLVIDAQYGNIKFKSDSDPDAFDGFEERSLSKASLDFLAKGEYAPFGATHVHIGDSRRVCIEGRHSAMNNYTAYAVAYFKERKLKKLK